MNVSKLFSVLVVGGSLWVAGCAEDGGGTGEREVVTGPDASGQSTPQQTDGGQPGSADGGGSELAPCFCDQEACCDDGVLEEGFECCWMTSC